ncbi:hypothetical protein [Halogeometricum limi]|uniref:Uncharacterized protein n=1 Tax=Halogeometricum limi TaxID=555875 RepID=A0A1I6IFC5_9EURY|nr:hypothetical protein [Halogeometricum limi]SFR65442.1 hypothetical protein SAMN04488124_3190 [Halogeometricum limi]
MYTKEELDDGCEPVDADECTEMNRAAELGYTVEAISTLFEFEKKTVQQHLHDDCKHY